MTNPPTLMDRPAKTSGPMIDKVIVRANNTSALPANPPYELGDGVVLKLGDTVYNFYNLTYEACMFTLKPGRNSRYYFNQDPDAFALVEDNTDDLVARMKEIDRHVDKLTRERARIAQNKMRPARMRSKTQ